jgi:hypothetical protein
VDWLSTDRRFPGEPRFPALATAGMIEVEVERDGQTSLSRRYYLSSAPSLRRPVRPRRTRPLGRREPSSLGVLDVVFHDDLMRLRTENGPVNTATIKHAALNLIKQIPDKASLKIKKKTASWDDNYLFNTVSQSWT